jgi:hypothetical protein
VLLAEQAVLRRRVQVPRGRRRPSGYAPRRPPGSAERARPGGPYERALQRQQHPPPTESGAKSRLIGLGIPVLLLLAAIVFVYTNNTAHECGSSLVYALSQSACNRTTLLHADSIVAGVAGVAAIIIGIAKR